MKSFRTELEDLQNPIVEQDIIDLNKKIQLFHEGKIEEDKFKSLRLARGVYGQRQTGVQMVRIKIPFGKMTANQLKRIADISEEYGSGNLHATTRQDIQIHYVSLDRTPELWAKLEQEEITLREACGNTVRNITASPKAGIDPEEPFDVSPYAYEMFQYFLRNPVCQDMGRKFKISFSSSEKDTGLSFIHDIGFIPQILDGKRGFRLVIGGGLGAQPVSAQLAHDFLPEDQIIPFTEALLRVFDRHGERKRRVKARMKFLLADIGIEKLLDLVNQEWKAIKHKSYPINTDSFDSPKLPFLTIGEVSIPEADETKFNLWYQTNVFEQKQKTFYGVHLKVPKGDISATTARQLASIIEEHAADDIRVTANQGYTLRFVKKEALKSLFLNLTNLGLADPGFDGTADITACPGTDSCNLGISNSTSVALALENVIQSEYPDLIANQDIKIKISGCPNSCGQHGIASIGFHGSSLRNKLNKKVLPALQVLLGGGIKSGGEGFIAEKVIKVPSKKGPDVLRTLLDDYAENGNEGEYFAYYFRRQGKDYFYQMLKPLANPQTLEASDYIDWGQDSSFSVQTEVGECAGVIIDLVSTLVFEAEEKADSGKKAFEAEAYADAIYHAYSTFVNGAKALLTFKGVEANTQAGLLNLFEENFNDQNFGFVENTFKSYVLKIKQNEPSKNFAEAYLAESINFLSKINDFLEKEETAKPVLA